MKPTHESFDSQVLAEVGQTALNQNGCYSVLRPLTTPGCQVVTAGSGPERRLGLGELSHKRLEVARMRMTAENSQSARATSEKDQENDIENIVTEDTIHEEDHMT